MPRHADMLRSLRIAARLLAALALLAVPVSARAGLDAGHPHGLLQLVLDAGDGSLDHHADSVAAAGGPSPGRAHSHGHAHGHAHSAADWFDPARAGAPEHARSGPEASGVGPGTGVAGEGPAGARLVPAAAAGIATAAAAVAVTAPGMAQDAPGRRLWWRLADGRAGHAHAPDVPPPRRLPGHSRLA